MGEKTLPRAVKICLGVFWGYVVLYGIASYLDFYIKYSEFPRYPLGTYYSLRFYFLPLLVPLVTGYLIMRDKSKDKLLLALNFMIVALLLLSMFLFLYSVFHSTYKPFSYQAEHIKFMDKFLEFLFFSSVSYFLFAPLSFSLWIWGKRMSSILLGIVFMVTIASITGFELVFSIIDKLPRFFALPIILIIFPPLSEPPLPFAGVGLVYNIYLWWRAETYSEKYK